MKKIEEIKKEYDKIWGDKLKNTPMAKEIWALIAETEVRIPVLGTIVKDPKLGNRVLFDKDGKSL